MANKYADLARDARSRRYAARQERRRADCQRKAAFDTEAEALAQNGMDAYECEFCGKWHRTKSAVSKIKSVPKKRRPNDNPKQA